MPSSILTADTMFPNFRDDQSTGEKLDTVTNYLYMLLEQLRYTLANLGSGNFNEAELNGIANWITEPVYVKLDGVEGEMATFGVTLDGLFSRMTDAEGNISVLTQTADGLAARMTDAEGNISVLTQTADGLAARITNTEGDITSLTAVANGLSTRVTDAEGNISVLTQTAEGLSTRITGAEGNITSLTQTVDSISLSVVNGSDMSIVSLTKNGVSVSAQVIQMTGVVKFTDLSTSGSTVINGDNITTGTISAITMNSCVMQCTLNSGYTESDGKINFYYLLAGDANLLAGSIYLDNLGAGTAGEATYRMVIRSYTTRFGGYPFVLKLLSDGNISMEAGGAAYISAAGQISMYGSECLIWSRNALTGGYMARIGVSQYTQDGATIGVITLEAGAMLFNGSIVISGSLTVNGTVIG